FSAGACPAVTDRAAIMPPKELDGRDQPEPHRDNALPTCPPPSLVEQVPKPVTNKEPDLPCGVQNAVARLRDINRIELALAEFAKAGDREHAARSIWSSAIPDFRRRDRGCPAASRR